MREKEQIFLNKIINVEGVNEMKDHQLEHHNRQTSLQLLKRQRQEDGLSPELRGQPGQHSESPVSNTHTHKLLQAGFLDAC